jgi:hypothetical protein
MEKQSPMSACTIKRFSRPSKNMLEEHRRQASCGRMDPSCHPLCLHLFVPSLLRPPIPYRRRPKSNCRFAGKPVTTFSQKQPAQKHPFLRGDSDGLLTISGNSGSSRRSRPRASSSRFRLRAIMASETKTESQDHRHLFHRKEWTPRMRATVEFVRRLI